MRTDQEIKDQGDPVPQPCYQCGDTEATFGPDPYAEEIGGDDAPVWECACCRYQSAMDI